MDLQETRSAEFGIDLVWCTGAGAPRLTFHLSQSHDLREGEVGVGTEETVPTICKDHSPQGAGIIPGAGAAVNLGDSAS